MDRAQPLSRQRPALRGSSVVHANDDAWPARGHGPDRGGGAENSAAGEHAPSVLMKAAIGFTLLAVVCRLPGQDVPADPLAPMTPADVANGKRLFEAQCAPCHGIDGRGGKAPTSPFPGCGTQPITR